MEKLNRAQKCSILGPQNLGSRAGLGPPGAPLPLNPYLHNMKSFHDVILKLLWNYSKQLFRCHDCCFSTLFCSVTNHQTFPINWKSFFHSTAQYCLGFLTYFHILLLLVYRTVHWMVPFKIILLCWVTSHELLRIVLKNSSLEADIGDSVIRSM